jgi:hypothetical protein
MKLDTSKDAFIHTARIDALGPKRAMVQQFAGDRLILPSPTYMDQTMRLVVWSINDEARHSIERVVGSPAFVVDWFNDNRERYKDHEVELFYAAEE